MNKIFRLLPFVVAAVCTLSVSSCGDDDDDNNNNSPASVVLEGNPTTPEQVAGNTWVLNFSKSSAYGEMNGVKGPMDMKATDANGVIPTTMTFYADGKADIDVSGTASKGSFEIEGKEFTLNYEVLMNKKDWNGSLSSVQRPFTLVKDADLLDVIEKEFGYDSEMMKEVFTKCEVTKLGNQLILNLTVTTIMNMGNDDDFDIPSQFQGIFDVVTKSKKYVAYHLVYDKK